MWLHSTTHSFPFSSFFFSWVAVRMSKLKLVPPCSASFLFPRYSAKPVVYAQVVPRTSLLLSLRRDSWFIFSHLKLFGPSWIAQGRCGCPSSGRTRICDLSHGSYIGYRQEPWHHSFVFCIFLLRASFYFSLEKKFIRDVYREPVALRVSLFIFVEVFDPHALFWFFFFLGVWAYLLRVPLSMRQSSRSLKT